MVQNRVGRGLARGTGTSTRQEVVLDRNGQGPTHISVSCGEVELEGRSSAGARPGRTSLSLALTSGETRWTSLPSLHLCLSRCKTASYNLSCFIPGKAGDEAQDLTRAKKAKGPQCSAHMCGVWHCMVRNTNRPAPCLWGALF